MPWTFALRITELRNPTWLNVHGLSQYFGGIYSITFKGNASGNWIYSYGKVNLRLQARVNTSLLQGIASITKISYIFKMHHQQIRHRQLFS